MNSEVIDNTGYRLKLKRIIPGNAYRLITIIGNSFLYLVPHKLKYSLGTFFRKHKAPYKFVKNGDAVIQVGMPRDILLAGRSRAIYFSYLVGNGKVVVIEPDSENISAAKDFVKRHKMEDKFIFFPCGAWSHKDTLIFLSNPDHPASNVLLEANREKEVWSEIEKKVNTKAYQRHSVPVDSIDNLFGSTGLPSPKVISITTNGAELQIVSGMLKTIEKGVPYISLASAFSKGYVDFMGNLKYQLIAKDDRGYSFEKIQ